MDDDRLSVIDAASRLGKHTSTVYKMLKRIGVTPTKERHPDHGNQVIGFITTQEFNLLHEYVETTPSIENNGNSPDVVIIDRGAFYLLQLEPEHDPGRFKVGFASNMNDRLRALRCSAPFATIVDTWPCHRLWEKTAIDCVTNGCKQLHTEVFRTDALESVIEKCNAFFALMPKLEESDPQDATDGE